MLALSLWLGVYVYISWYSWLVDYLRLSGLFVAMLFRFCLVCNSVAESFVF